MLQSITKPIRKLTNCHNTVCRTIILLLMSEKARRLMNKMDNHLVLIYHAFEVATRALASYYKLVHNEESIETVEDDDVSKFPILLLQLIWETFETHLRELISVVNGIKVPIITALFTASCHSDGPTRGTGAGTFSQDLKLLPGTHLKCERNKVKLTSTNSSPPH